ncbi:hypothetical protein EDC04DRAFT_2599550 [Pisolithus marmoratus]|nr:hypothetical protein EDC04DRAFT_2599550 [Pisolithus marmoratus]
MGLLVNEQEIIDELRPILQQAINKMDGRIGELEKLVAHLAMGLRGDVQKIANNIEVFATGALVVLAVWLAVHIYREMKREGRERKYHAERMRALRRANKDATASDSVSDSKDLVEELSQTSEKCGGYFRMSGPETINVFTLGFAWIFGSRIELTCSKFLRDANDYLSGPSHFIHPKSPGRLDRWEETLRRLGQWRATECLVGRQRDWFVPRLQIAGRVTSTQRTTENPRDGSVSQGIDFSDMDVAGDACLIRLSTGTLTRVSFVEAEQDNFRSGYG